MALASLPCAASFDIFVDSGAGQSLFSSSEAFIPSSLQMCSIEVEGVSGCLSVQAIGTARFLVRCSDGSWVICLVPNALLTNGRHHLLSVSQFLGTPTNSVSFADPPHLSFAAEDSPQLSSLSCSLQAIDGLYSLRVVLVSPNDPCLSMYPTVFLTATGMYEPPSSLPGWSCRILIAPIEPSFREALSDFASSYVAPLAVPPSRRTFVASSAMDMTDLAARFMGTGHDRLQQTIELSLGLTVSPGRVPPLLFPQGRHKRGKTPVVAKSKVSFLHRASVAEVVFTDIFQTDDVGFKYGSAFVDYRSRYGAVYPITSKKLVGASFVAFCADHFCPLILVRDGAGENVGGDLMEECLHRSVQSAFSCPHTPQQDQAEGYLGRVTSMASFALVYSGAPLYFWRWAILAAVFVNNITASWYSREGLWAQPYYLVHGETFPDSSIVMPFGCAVLVMLTKAEISKFKSRCALMIFIHYATTYPLYTYALYSPVTRRVVHRQDCIFLTDVFPFRLARQSQGLSADGDLLVPYSASRSPPSIRDLSCSALSFGEWSSPTLPGFVDLVGPMTPERPPEEVGDPVPLDRPVGLPSRTPAHPAFGPSLVQVPCPPEMASDSPVVPVVLPVPITHPRISFSTQSTPRPFPRPDSLDAEAQALLGGVFLDDEFGWCVVNAWGTHEGEHVLFYRPSVSLDVVSSEEYSSMTQVKAWIAASPVLPIGLEEVSRPYRPPPRLVLMCSKVGQRTKGAVLSSRRPVFRIGGHRHFPLLKASVLRKILSAKESIFKYGIYVPRNDRDADKTPERVRWSAGRELEWLRLADKGTFDGTWTKARMALEYPTYSMADIGFMFFVYDYKFSGEHRVRLVYDGSRQSPQTFTETYAPTVRADSVRFFHVYLVEFCLRLGQYDVPQAFLQSEVDCDLFVYPPKGFATRKGQILKMKRMLYGAKQSACLWFKKLDQFLRSLGFVTGPLDPCFFKRFDEVSQTYTLIILHCDDLRVAATESVLQEIHDALWKEYEITSTDCTRFLGMDCQYDYDAGILTLSMTTYIQATLERFTDFDCTLGVPYRELVGCLLWAVLCVHGPELLRVKDLAQRSNQFTPEDYKVAFNVLERLVQVKDLGIVFRKGGAGKERVPSSTRSPEGSSSVPLVSVGAEAIINELGERDLYGVSDSDDVVSSGSVLAFPVSTRFSLTAYTDASFAVGPRLQSVSGWIVMVNGIPMLWGSLRQTVVVDSSCSAEYVATSICMKEVKAVENMLAFLDIQCPVPYTVYTDSTASLHIGSNSTRLGRVRHLAIRCHMVRCYIALGEMVLVFCVTEEMLADIFTKIVSSDQDRRLSFRFYNDCVWFSP